MMNISKIYTSLLIAIGLMVLGGHKASAHIFSWGNGESYLMGAEVEEITDEDESDEEEKPAEEEKSAEDDSKAEEDSNSEEKSDEEEPATEEEKFVATKANCNSRVCKRGADELIGKCSASYLEQLEAAQGGGEALASIKANFLKAGMAKQCYDDDLKAKFNNRHPSLTDAIKKAE